MGNILSRIDDVSTRENERTRERPGAGGRGQRREECEGLGQARGQAQSSFSCISVRVGAQFPTAPNHTEQVFGTYISSSP